VLALALIAYAYVSSVDVEALAAACSGAVCNEQGSNLFTAPAGRLASPTAALTAPPSLLTTSRNATLRKTAQLLQSSRYRIRLWCGTRSTTAS
jgi:hypothetical protein